MGRLERMKEIVKAFPNFGKGVGYKMCVVDEFNDTKELKTSEEMTEEYAKGLCKTCTFDTCRYSTIKTCAIKESIKQACFAGIKVGAEQQKKKSDNQLTHAKEVIMSLLNTFVYDMAEEDLDVGQIDVRIRAEQFLREV